MSKKQSKQIIPEKKDQSKRSSSTRSRLVFEEPHIFRVKSERSLPQLQETREFLPCVACLKEANRRQETFNRPHSSYTHQQLTRPRSSEPRPSTGIEKKHCPAPPTPANLERLSRPKTFSPEQISNNYNWNNFIQKKSKYAIKTPYAQCNVTYNQENSEIRPPFVNYGGRYDDKQHGEKRTYNSLAVHQLKHHKAEEQRLADLLRERRLRLQAKMYFREMEERKARAQELRDRAARASTEYRDNYRPPYDYNGEGTFSRH
ncbi:unnamed protein product [Rotaria sordida]|uniref:Uncharacterized protein n=3 Tax=Rotaria sordida TaxID=392033 RepID=A0A815PFR1_9BILA|nr:unnamed protein product [Rotaria sordida]